MKVSEMENEQDELDKNTVSPELYVTIPKTNFEGLLARLEFLLQIYLTS